MTHDESVYRYIDSFKVGYSLQDSFMALCNSFGFIQVNENYQ